MWETLGVVAVVVILSPVIEEVTVRVFWFLVDGEW